MFCSMLQGALRVGWGHHFIAFHRHLESSLEFWQQKCQIKFWLELTQFLSTHCVEKIRHAFKDAISIFCYQKHKSASSPTILMSF